MQKKSRAVWLLVWVVAVAATFAGCSGDEGGVAGNQAGFGNASGSGGNGVGGGGGNIDIDANTQALTIEPATATLTLTSAGQPASQPFSAKLGSNTVAATWSLSNYNFVNIDSSGVATTTALGGGKVTVTAMHQGKVATAELTVNVVISEDVDPSVDPTDKAALSGAPVPDPGASESPPNPTRFLYPYDETVMARGIVAPFLMVSAGSVPPQSAKVKLSAPFFSWEGFYTVAAPATPRFAIPQAVWEGAVNTAAGGKLTVEVVKASSGSAYGPYSIAITIADGSLKGVVYYLTYENPSGLWSVRPGDTTAAKHVKPGCVVCHSVSANGKFLSTGAEWNVQSAEAGVYEVDAFGNATQMTPSPAGLGGDSRGLSFASWTPDGSYVMRSQNDFWGGVNQLAWRVDATTQSLTPATVVGLGPGLSAYLPAFSHDGKRYVFTQGHGDASPPGSLIRSLNVMDVSIDPNTGPGGTLTFSNRAVALDNGPTGKVVKYATFLPDSNLIVVQESQDFDPAHGGMLATRSSGGVYGGADGRLNLVNVSQSGHVELAKANQGNAATDENHNYEPFALPIPAGGYYWVVFTSIREYGNLHQGGAVRKQLWVTAISPGGSGDPSHPPFFLPNQTDTKNERGYWALDPCKATGQSCQTGDECCEGFCRPSDENDPSSPKVCGVKKGCSQVSEKCETDLDCCAPETGIRCLGGFCSPQPPS